jgi:hypothetical protein
MLIANQTVEVKWNARRKEHFEEKGYLFTKAGSIFVVRVEDLTKHSKMMVKVKCDYCGKTVEKIFSNYVIENEKNKIAGIYKDACKECQGTKNSENYGTEYMDNLEILEEEIVVQHGHSEEFLIGEFYRYRDEFGIYPRKIDMEGNKEYPSASSYYNKWSNWNNFLSHLDLVGDSGLYKEDEQTIREMYPNDNYIMKDINERLIQKRSIYEMKKITRNLGIEERCLYVERSYNKSLSHYETFFLALKDLESDIGKCPTSSDYDAYTKLNKLSSRRFIEKETGKKYSELCKDILNNVNNVNNKSKELLKNELLNLSVQLGRTPQASELVHYGLSTRKAYVKEFGMSFLDILKSIDLTPSNGQDRTFMSNEEMLEGFLRLKEEIGHTPFWSDIDECAYIPSYKTYINRFKSSQNIYKLLGLTESDVNQEMSGGVVSLNNKGEICKSIPELKISNLFIDNNLLYDSEEMYSKFDKNLKARWVMDWYLSDYGIYVEYFGLYNKNHINKKNRNGRYTRKAERKIKYCQDNNISLISLYPDDLANGYLGLLSKFKDYGIDLKSKQVA